MAEFEYERISKILWDDFAAALRTKEAARESFEEVMTEIPSGLPTPDGAQRIKNIAHHYSETRQKLRVAMDRLQAFKNRGIIPEDLKKGPRSEDCVGSAAKSGSGAG